MEFSEEDVGKNYVTRGNVIMTSPILTIPSALNNTLQCTTINYNNFTYILHGALTIQRNKYRDREMEFSEEDVGKNYVTRGNVIMTSPILTNHFSAT